MKSLAGEPIQEAEFTHDGVAGERLVHVQGPRGVLTGRTRYTGPERFDVRARCVVTTIDPDTGAQDLDVHRRIRHEFGGVLCLDSWVIQPGVVHVGDAVEVVPTDELPDRIGGWIVGRPYAV